MTAELIDALAIERVAHGGHCVARHEGRVVFVRHALPGETVRARLTESGTKATFWRADAVEIVSASPDRVEHPWALAGPGGVGGAELGHVRLEAQRRWKLAVLVEAFERFARRDFPGDVVAAPDDDARRGLAYRTRVAATADAQGRASMHRHRTRDLVALDAMPLAVPVVEEALLGQRFPAGARVSVASSSIDETVRITVNGEPFRAGRADKRPNAPRAVRERVELSDGRAWEYRVDAEGFWQVHRDAPAVLVEAVLARVPEAGRVADLYAGAGLFTLPLAADGREVIAVESHPGAVRAVRRNLHAHPQATVIDGDVRETLRAGIDPCETVVLDPPRSGAGAATLDAVARIGASTVVYVACDPVALARDTALLSERGYDLVEAQAFDLFPMTHHIETVATFRAR